MIVLANDDTIEVTAIPGERDDLWIRTDELERATGWDLKPEGVCCGDTCVPLLGDEKTEWVRSRDDGEWIKYSSFADKVGQKHVAGDGIWSLGVVPETRRGTLESGVAPDFEATDRNGETFRLSDFRGKKVLVVTWASW